jgi:hypothetical protein
MKICVPPYTYRGKCLAILDFYAPDLNEEGHHPGHLGLHTEERLEGLIQIFCGRFGVTRERNLGN